MPVYQIEGPDGAIYEIEGPEGATPEQVRARVMAGLESGTIERPRPEPQPETVQQAYQRNLDTARQFLGQGRSHVAGMGGMGGDVPIIAEGPAPAPQVLPGPSALDQLVGAGETALTLASGGTGGMLGTAAGALAGAANEIWGGEFGSQEAADRIERMAQEWGGALTYEPETEAARQQLEELSKVIGALPPIVGAPQFQMAGQAANVARGTPPQLPAPTLGPRSIGAAEQAAAEVARQRGQGLPIPLTGDRSRLTTGQASRDFGQLAFEKEIAKDANLGAPLRDRILNQNEVLRQNLEAFRDPSQRPDYAELLRLPGTVENLPATFDPREIGKSVDAALRARRTQRKGEVTAAYRQAREAGEMEAPTRLSALPGVFDEFESMEGMAPNLTAARREAGRLGLINDDGQPMPQPLDKVETYRQFVGNATDWADPRQSMIARRLQAAIDEGMDVEAGPAFQRARGIAKSVFKEFDNSEITRQLLATKNKSVDARRKAFEDVGRYVVSDSSLEEMNKLRASLLRAGDDGKQAWSNLKSYTMTDIMRKGYGNQLDERGQPVLNPASLKKAVDKLDTEGKLESMFGRQQAQQIRDVAEMVQLVNTAPTGAVNFSNTTAAALNRLGWLAGEAGLNMAATGLPISPIALMNMLAGKGRQIRTQRGVERALRGE